MADEKGQAIGWDEPPVEKPNEGGEFTLLPDGKYPFKVKMMERGRFEGSAKMCACPVAILTCEVDGGEFGTTTIKNNMHLNLKVQGIHASFFASIGLRKHGDPLVYAWHKVPGSTGWCKVGTRTYNEKQYNEIKAWIDAPESKQETVPPAEEHVEDEIPFD